MNHPLDPTQELLYPCFNSDCLRLVHHPEEYCCVLCGRNDRFHEHFLQHTSECPRALGNLPRPGA